MCSVIKNNKQCKIGLSTHQNICDHHYNLWKIGKQLSFIKNFDVNCLPEQKVTFKNVMIEPELPLNTINSNLKCKACFEDFPIDQLIACSKASTKFHHVMCHKCVDLYTQTLCKNKYIDTKCCYFTYGITKCDGIFSLSDFQKCMTLVELDEFIELCEFTELTNLAKSSDNFQFCPTCGKYGLIVDSTIAQKVNCLKCNIIWCTKCKTQHNDSHCYKIYDRNNREQIRKMIENIINLYKIKKCPGCQKKYIKDLGCDHITCNCGVNSCYKCCQIINKTQRHVCTTNTNNDVINSLITMLNVNSEIALTIIREINNYDKYLGEQCNAHYLRNLKYYNGRGRQQDKCVIN